MKFSTFERCDYIGHLFSLADGVENAAVVCCFITADYEKSKKCKYELQYAKKRGRIIIPCLLDDTKVCEQSDWLTPIIKDLYHISLDESDMQSTATEIIHYIDYYQSRNVAGSNS